MSDPPLPFEVDISPSTIERLVGRPIGDFTLYRRALTHRSLLRVYPEHSFRSNERLEFLGDAFLDLIVGEILYHRFPEKSEGALSRFRARLVSEAPLAMYARHLDLGEYLLMSENAARDNGRDNPSILADAFEALTGALYLDQGHETARSFVRDRVLGAFDISEIATRNENYKSQLLEYMQARGRAQPTYRVVQEEGPSHDKTFTVVVEVGETTYEQGTASSKQRAEQEAARRTLHRMEINRSTMDSIQGEHE